MDLKTKKGLIAHNLKVAALIKRDAELVKKYAQEAFDADYELEELGYSDHVFLVIANAVVASGWVPEINGSEF